ncbi:L,D-transpeptidase family protein [Ancylobacter oerskovii]|nr:L,D-transpeptidase family protein [Ancylobacter oerskovii]
MRIQSGIRTSGVRAGNGTGDVGRAFDPIAVGMRRTGQGASLLAALNGDPAPFDMNTLRGQPPAVEAVPAAEPPAQPAAAQPATPAATDTAPAVGAGAPAMGAGTPGAAQPAAATPAAATNVSATEPGASSVVAARIGELLAGPQARFGVKPNEREALAAFYAARQYQPVFTAGTAWSSLGTAVQQQVANSWQDGLQPADYEVPALSAHPGEVELAEAELKLASALMLYARHVQSGRFDPKRISANVDPSPTVPDPNAVLAGVSGAADPRAALAAFAPQYDEYRLLKMQLAGLEGERHGVAPPHVPAGPTLRPGDEDPRVPALRARLGLVGTPEDTLYDPDLVEAVRAFQRSAGERPDGAVGPVTLAALNGAGEDRTADIIANMERWRWLPHEVAPTYVIVNIPEYMVRIVVDEQTIHETRVIVGKPENQTPVMTENMQYTVFNPSWNVPPGIMRNEMLPKLRSDPYALARQGIDVVRNGRVIDPGTVDWSRGSQGYSFRQPPGERNALGNMKFMFPNKHSVYLHDTPNRTLFARDQRALSHGCVRVHEPMKFAEVLFSLGLPGEGWNQQRISKLIGGKERYLNLKQRFPVHLAYFTTYVDGEGRLVTRPDLYGTNAATKAILGIGGAAQVADGGNAPRRR